MTQPLSHVVIGQLRIQLFCWMTLGFCFSCLAEANSSPVSVATYSYPGIDRTAAITPLGNFIGSKLARETVIREYNSPTELINAVARGEVDIAVPNLYGFLKALSKGLNVVAIAVPDVPHSKAEQYRSVLIANADENIKTEQDLVQFADDIRVELVWADSTSGGIVPMTKLLELGFHNPDVQFKSFAYSGSHEKAIDNLLAHMTDLTGLALGVLEERLKTQPNLSQSFAIIWTSPPIPVGPILCIDSDTIDCNILAESLLSENSETRQLMQALNIGWPEFGGATKLISPNMTVYERLQLQKNQK